MKSFLGNFYRHSAIFSGHTAYVQKNFDERKRAILVPIILFFCQLYDFMWPLLLNPFVVTGESVSFQRVIVPISLIEMPKKFLNYWNNNKQFLLLIKTFWSSPKVLHKKKKYNYMSFRWFILQAVKMLEQMLGELELTLALKCDSYTYELIGPVVLMVFFRHLILCFGLFNTVDGE